MMNSRCQHGFDASLRPGGHCPRCLLEGNGPPEEPRLVLRDLPPLEELGGEFPAYRLERVRGRGGMGAVLEARHRELDRPVAIKVLLADLEADSDFEERFRREGRIMARLDHPHIVRIYDFGRSPGGWCFFVMELVDGVDMARLIRQRDFGVPEALRIVSQLCEALQYAHDSGVVHRDIKPSNVLITTDGGVKVADFGLVKLMGEEPAAPLTISGTAVGTPHYVAPEQLRGEPDVDHRADIYSLGVLFYELLTGQLPMGVFTPPSVKAETDTRLDGIVLKAMQERREDRYQAASEVREAVSSVHLRQPEPRTAGRSRKLLAAGAVTAAAAVLAIALRPAESASGSRAAPGPQPTRTAEDFTPARQQEMLDALVAANPECPPLKPTDSAGRYTVISKDAGRWRVTLTHPSIRTLEPLRGWPIHIACVLGTEVTDYTPLLDCPVRNLLITMPEGSDLSQFRRFPLQELALAAPHLTDLATVVNPGLKALHVSHSAITSLEPLRGCPLLTNLTISHTGVTDLEPLRGLKISSLNADSTPLVSLEPLRGMPLFGVNLTGTRVTDFSPLLESRQLQLRCDAGTFSQPALADYLRRQQEKPTP